VGTGVLVALIASVTSLIAAGASLYFQYKSAKEEREEKRRSDAKVVLDKYRGPLLKAAWDLGHRINNNRKYGFPLYMAPGSGHDQQVKLTTLFRIAQYFGWCEILRTEAQLLRFEREADTQLVATLIGDVHWAFATDKVDDRRNGMLWAEEQRAIGELMVVQVDGMPSTCYGYARFVREYEERFSPWMDRIAKFLRGEEAKGSHRLRLVQWGLLGIVKQLDEEHIYTDHNWMVQAQKELKEHPSSEPITIESNIRRDTAKAGCVSFDLPVLPSSGPTTVPEVRT
jgi:hypothetical protein